MTRHKALKGLGKTKNRSERQRKATEDLTSDDALTSRRAPVSLRVVTVHHDLDILTGCLACKT